MHPTFYTYEVPSGLQVIGDVLCSNVIDKQTAPHSMPNKVSVSEYTSSDTIHITQQTNANIKRNKDKCKRSSFYLTNTENGFNPFCHHTRIVVADVPLVHSTTDCKKIRDADLAEVARRHANAIMDASRVIDADNVYKPSDILISGQPGTTVTRYVTESNGTRRVYTTDPYMADRAREHISDKVSYVVDICDTLALGINVTDVEKTRQKIAMTILGDANPDRLVSAIRQKYRQSQNTNTNMSSYQQFLNVAERLGYVKKGSVAALMTPSRNLV